MTRLLLALVALVWGGAVLAGPVDCTGDAFRKALALKPSYGFDCVEVKSVPSPVDGGGWTIRAVRNKSTEEGYVLPFAELALQTFTKAFQVWDPYAADLGLSFRNVTIVFVDPEGSEINFDFKVHGHGKGVGAAHVNGLAFPDDCVVSVNIPEIKALELEAMGNILAHEAFHCVQAWSFGAANAPGDGAQAWWQEGTAEFFASMVEMDAGRYLGFADSFLTTIDKKPLTQQAYNSTIFFAFLWQQGSGVMGGFLKGLATSPGEMAQMQATEKALGDELLVRFAEAVVDGSIALPTGMQFPALETLAQNVFSTDGQFDSGKVSFTIDAHDIDFVGGSFAVADAARYRVREVGGSVWGDMPTMVEPENCKVPKEYLAVRLVGTKVNETLGFPVVVTRYKECQVCQALPEQDACLVGTWALRQDSLLSYLQKAAVDSKDVTYSSISGDVALVMTKDGSAQWLSQGLQIEAVVSSAQFPYDIDISVQTDGIVSGRWSTGASSMNFCAESQDIDQTSTVKIPGLAEDVVTSTGPLEDSFLIYECHPKVLTLIYTGPNSVEGPAPTWVLDRIK